MLVEIKHGSIKWEFVSKFKIIASRSANAEYNGAIKANCLILKRLCKYAN